jgi:hypothetical protein
MHLSLHCRWNRFFCLFSILLATSLIASTFACAQQYTRNEVTVGMGLQTYSVESCAPIAGTPFCNPAYSRYLSYPTPTFDYTRNLSPSLAIVGTFQPTSAFSYNNMLDSGRETLALGGVKTGWRGRRWGVYGDVEAGVASFSCGDWYSYPKLYSHCTKLTSFALEYGGIVEYHLSPRYSIRGTTNYLQIARFDYINARYSDGEPALYTGGAIEHHLDARIGITRSFGKLQDAEPERDPGKQSWDAGVNFALQPRIQPTFMYLNAYQQWGLWASWNFSRHVSWDTTLQHSPRNPGAIEDIDYQAGGRAFEALTGAKIGVRRDHMGYFAVVRPGIITFGETERQINEGPNKTFVFDKGMFTNFVLNTGGAYEIYPSKHTILRFDAGSATIFYQPKTVIEQGQKFPISGRTQPSMFVGFGAGIRF